MRRSHFMVGVSGAMSVVALAPLSSRALANDVASFRLIATPMRFTPSPGVTVDAIGYNGSIPGPLLRVRRGQRVHVEYVNASAIATSVHWHGVILPKPWTASRASRKRPSCAAAASSMTSRRSRPARAGTTITPTIWASCAGSSACS
ncbi:MAG: multicopper oxidase domain-containing protein [Candidatus Aquilonibacter sp.]